MHPEIDLEIGVGGNHPKYVSREQIAAEVAALQRDVFADVLVDVLECKPDKESVERWAKKYPDRYFASLAVLAGLSGFQKDINVTTNVHLVGALPDSVLIQRLAQAERQLALSCDARKMNETQESMAAGAENRAADAKSQHHSCPTIDVARSIDDDDRTIDMETRER